MLFCRPCSEAHALRQPRWLLLGLLLWGTTIVAGDLVPRGSILAFLPDFESGDYRDPAGLRQWLAAQGWVICDGANGTPDLNHRYLVGAGEAVGAGQRVGSKSHQHRIRAQTGPEQGRERRFGSGHGYSIRYPIEGHRHGLDAETASATHYPPSLRVLFIMRVR